MLIVSILLRANPVYPPIYLEEVEKFVQRPYLLVQISTVHDQRPFNKRKRLLTITISESDGKVAAKRTPSQMA